jgi:hypothetical protein
VASVLAPVPVVNEASPVSSMVPVG